jgi:hypothetical protein
MVLTNKPSTDPLIYILDLKEYKKNPCVNEYEHHELRILERISGATILRCFL